jgi:hypothetical protein
MRGWNRVIYLSYQRKFLGNSSSISSTKKSKVSKAFDLRLWLSHLFLGKYFSRKFAPIVLWRMGTNDIDFIR